MALCYEKYIKYIQTETWWSGRKQWRYSSQKSCTVSTYVPSRQMYPPGVCMYNPDVCRLSGSNRLTRQVVQVGRTGSPLLRLDCRSNDSGWRGKRGLAIFFILVSTYVHNNSKRSYALNYCCKCPYLSQTLVINWSMYGWMRNCRQ